VVTQKFLQDLQQGDEKTRRQIITQQLLPADPEIVPYLINCLSDPSGAICEAAVDVLGNCTDPTSIGQIVSRLNSPNPVESNYVLEIIQKLGNSALPAIVIFMDDNDRNIRKQAIDALAVVASEDVFFPLQLSLKDPDPIVVSSAAEVLGQLHFNQAVPILQEALNTDNVWIKVAVLSSLGQIGGIEALQTLCSFSHDQPETVMTTVIQAVESASEADPDLAINFLITLLKQDQHAFEGYILGVLVPLIQKNNSLSPDQQQLVLQSAKNLMESENPSFFATAIKGIALISNFKSGELSRFAKFPNYLVRSATLQAMLLTRDIDTPVVASIAFNNNEQIELRIQAIHVLAKTTDWNTSIESKLLVSAEEDNFRIRIAAINTLLEWKNEKGFDAILELFGDRENFDEEIFVSEFELNSADLFVKLIEIGFRKLDNQSRYRMFHALCPLERKDELVLNRMDEYKIVINAIRDTYWSIRVHAARLYGNKFAENEHLLVLIASQDPDERVRTTVINILNDGHKLNQELIILLLHDNSLRVRRAVLMIILEMENSQISDIVRTEALKTSLSKSNNEDKEISDLEREIKRKFHTNQHEGNIPE